MLKTTLEVLAIGVAVIAAGSSAYQAYMLRTSLDTPYKSNLHGRVVTVCEQLILKNAIFETALETAEDVPAPVDIDISKSDLFKGLTFYSPEETQIESDNEGDKEKFSKAIASVVEAFDEIRQKHINQKREALSKAYTELKASIAVAKVFSGPEATSILKEFDAITTAKNIDASAFLALSAVKLITGYETLDFAEDWRTATEQHRTQVLVRCREVFDGKNVGLL